jgi:curved DNA-binding protein CbpA
MEDPYKILSITKNCTEQQLKDAYKKLVIVLHPDKPTGNAQLFKIVTDAFRKVAKDLKTSKSDKQYYELKSDYQKVNTNNITVDKDDFDIKRFNKVYDDNRLETATDTGYDDFLRNEKIKKQKEFTKGFTSDAFNNHFDKYTSANNQSKHLVKYAEPEPMQLAKQIQFTELGQNNIEDFSGENLSRKNLNYMDLKVAHTTNRIVDPKTVTNRKEYRNVEQLETDRANVAYTMNDKELREYHRRKQFEEQKEQLRIQTQMRLDKLGEEQFERTNRLLLGRR